MFSPKFITIGILAVFILGIFVFTSLYKPLVKAESVEKVDIGECQNVKITVLCEQGWKDTKLYLNELTAGGGLLESQWKKNMTMDNLTGVSYLVEVDGYKILYDPGANPKWIKETLKQYNIDINKIDFVFISHEHLDHFWALEGVLELKPDITVMIPNTFSSIAKSKIKEWGHTGKLIETRPNEPAKIYPGVASVAIPGKIMLDIDGEQHIYFNVKNKGLVTMTGCAHMGSVTILEWAKKHIKYDKLHGIVGGLHICPFANWSPEYEDILVYLSKQDLDHINPNHCTGKITGQRMNQLMPKIYKWASDGMVLEFGEGKS